MVLVILTLVFILAIVGVIDSLLRCIGFALDRTRGLFARVLIALVGLSIPMVVYAVIKPFFDGSTEGLAFFAYLLTGLAPVAVVFAVVGVIALRSRRDTYSDWIADQFRSRTGR